MDMTAEEAEETARQYEADAKHFKAQGRTDLASLYRIAASKLDREILERQAGE